MVQIVTIYVCRVTHEEKLLYAEEWWRNHKLLLKAAIMDIPLLIVHFMVPCIETSLQFF